MERNKIFISHQHNNDEVANKVLSVLENNGLECFVDHIHIPLGRDWSTRIEKELNECKFFILINSEDTVKSNGCYVELDRSIKSKKEIIVLNLGKFETGYKWDVLLASTQIAQITENNIQDVIKERVVPLFKGVNCVVEKKHETLVDFNKAEINKLREDTSDIYLRTSFNDYIDLSMKSNERLSIIKYKNNSGYDDNLYAKLIILDSDNIKFAYCNSIATIDESIELINKESSQDKYIVFVKSVSEKDGLNKILSIIANNEKVNFIVGINIEQDEKLDDEINDVKCLVFDKMSNQEVIEYLTQIEKEENTIIGANLKSIFLFPALYDFRTSKSLRIIINYIKKNCSSYKDSDYNLTDIFDFYDKYLEANTKANEAFERLISNAIKKKFNIFTLSEIGDDKNVLYENELICKKGVNYRISNEEYFLHRVAESNFSTYGSNYEEQDITAIKDSIPYYIYLYYRETKELILDKFELDETNMLKLLQLFISEDKALIDIVLSRKFDKEIIKFLNDSNEKGLYSITNKVINIFEKNNIEPTEELDFLSPKIEMHYNLTDELLETDLEFGNILAEKAYVCYQTDRFSEAGDLFEKAINKMIDSDSVNYKLIFNYIEFLFDFGDYNKIEELLNYIDNSEIGESDELLIKYYYCKAELDGYHLEFASCIDNLDKCISLCEKNVNISKLQVYYGEKGYYLMHQAKYEEAKKYIQINLDIAKSLGNYNGMAVASINLGICEFCTKNFNHMYKLFSYASVYAKNVKNNWRYSEALLYLLLLIKEKDKVDSIDDLISSVDSNIFRAYVNLLYSYYYFVNDNKESTNKKINEAIMFSDQIENVQLKEMIKAWSNYFSNGEIGKIDKDISKFMNDIIQALNELKESKSIYKSIIEFYLFKELNTERLKLRSMKISDIPDIYEYASNSECTKYVLFDKHKTFNDTAKFIANVYDENNVGDYMCWAIEHENDKKVIGTIDLSYNEKYQKAEIGYMLNKNYWRKGYGKEVVKSILKYCKDVLCLDQLLGVAFEVNEASRKLLESTGFIEFDKIENYHKKVLLKTKNGIAYQYIFNKEE